MSVAVSRYRPIIAGDSSFSLAKQIDTRAHEMEGTPKPYRGFVMSVCLFTPETIHLLGSSSFVTYQSSPTWTRTKTNCSRGSRATNYTIRE